MKISIEEQRPDSAFFELTRPDSLSSPDAGSANLYRNFAKRWLDIALVLIVAPTALSLILLFAAAVFLSDLRNPFYTQMRVGRGGKRFRMWKLRSMEVDAAAILRRHLEENPEARAEWQSSQKLRHDPRITRVGMVIRKCSIDELPQLFNVLNGTMSMVGPRPIMVEQLPLYHGRGYFTVRPGITGPWQVTGRHTTEFVARVFYDDDYARNMSLRGDLGFLAKTVGVVMRCTGV